jgi:Rieske Fe-S protein
VSEHGKSRRVFCQQSGRLLSAAAVGAALGPLLQGCNTFTYPTPVDVLTTVGAVEVNGAVRVTVGADSPLATVGGAALAQTSIGPLLLTRTAADACTALAGTCTHRVCAITGRVNQTFVCPCHGSQFDAAGQVVSGPAIRSLQGYATELADGVLTIRLS